MENAYDIGLTTLTESIHECLRENDYEGIEIPEDFAQQVFDLAWKYRGNRDDAISNKLVQELKNYIVEIFPEEDSK